MIHLTRPADHVAQLEIDNPPRNALGAIVREKLLPVLDALDADHGVRAIILTGTRETFCAGDDLREVQARGAAAGSALASFGAVLERIEAMRVPVIAAVNGPAFGGGLELALACDLRIASSKARFAGAGVNIGLMASVYRLPRLIGVARAKAMLLTGLPIDAETALSYGLVTEAHEAGALLGAALALAGRIASRAPLSVEAAKRQIGRAPDMTPDEAAQAGAAELERLTASADHREGVAAFLEKRDPVFTRS